MKLLHLSCLLGLTVFAHAEAPNFELRDGDRVLLLGDALLERENTLGFLEARMHAAWPQTKFTVRNLSWAGDTPKGWSRASFDGPAKGYERLKEQIALVKPTVVFLGYGMAASLQELTDRSNDIMLNRDTARYGEDPMSAARFKKELGELMTDIEAGGEKPRFFLLSPLQHEDLRATRPGTLDPAKHNELLAQYSKGIEELAKERTARFVDLSAIRRTQDGIHLTDKGYATLAEKVFPEAKATSPALTAAILKKNDLFFNRTRPANSTYLFGFRKHEQGRNAVEIPQYDPMVDAVDAEIDALKRQQPKGASTAPSGSPKTPSTSSTAVPGVQKETPTTSTIPPSSPAAVPNTSTVPPSSPATVPNTATVPPGSPATVSKPSTVPPGSQLGASNTSTAKNGSPETPSNTSKPLEPLPLPNFTMEEGYEISLWADTNLVGKPVGMNWDAAGRLWVACSPVYPMIAPGAHPEDKVVVIEDTDHDGKADKSTTFATNLLIAAGVAPDFASAGSEVDTSDIAKVRANGLPERVPPAQESQFVEAYLLARKAEELEKNGDLDGALKGYRAHETDLQKIQKQWPDWQKDIVALRIKKTQDSIERVTKAIAAGAPNHKSQITNHNAPPNAAYVGSSTELVHVTDTDGDGVADQRRVVLSGFGTEDTHHTLHTLKWGPDGRLYFNQSIYIHSHLETPYGMVRVNSGAIMAYDPRTERTEVIAKGWCNPWGHVWDEWGQQFTTDGAGGQGISWLVPGAMYFTYENAKKIMPSISPGSYPKFCGLELVRSPLFPAEWQGNAITCDFRAHRIARFSIKDLSPAKSGYETKAEADLVRTTDASFRPIDVKMGPDGALYVADWTNPVINHGEVDFRDPRRDHVNGRIWRIAPKGKAGVKWESLVGMELRHLPFGSSNEWANQQSAQLLSAAAKDDAAKNVESEKSYREFVKEQQRTNPGVVVDVVGPDTVERKLSGYTLQDVAEKGAITKERMETEIGGFTIKSRVIAQGRAAQLLEGVGGSPLFPMSELRGTQIPQASALTIRIASELLHSNFGDSDTRKVAYSFVKRGVESTNPRVRLEAMRALSRIPTAESAALVLEAAVNGGSPAALPASPTGQFVNSTAAADSDTHYAYAAWLSVNDLAPQVMEYVEKLAADPASAAKQQAAISFALQALPADKTGPLLSKIVAKNGAPKDGPWIELIGQTGGPAEAEKLLAQIAEPRAAAALIAAARRGVKPPGASLDVIKSAPAEVKADAIRLAGLWKLDAVEFITATMSGASQPVIDASFDALATLRTPAAATTLEALLAKGDAGLRRRALEALAAFKPDAALSALSTVAADGDDAAKLALFRSLFASEVFKGKFAAAIPKDLPKPAIAAALRASRELGRKGEALTNALTQAMGAEAPVATVDMPALVKATERGNPMEGEAIYRRLALACTACHAIGGAGGKVGPELMTIGASAPVDYIVESLFVPNAKVKEGYNAIALTLKGGRAASGVLLRETAEAVFLRDAAGNETSVPKADITARENVGSIMPAGLINALTDKEKASLFAFLSQLGKPGPFDATKANIARVWWLYPGKDVEAVVSGKITTPGAKTLTNVDGRLPKAALTDALQMVPEPGDMVVAVAKFAGAGKTRLNLQGVTKAYLDGAPLAIASNPSPEVELAAGNHTLVVKLDTKQLPENLRAECPEGRFATE